jgi:GxxExxY protein
LGFIPIPAELDRIASRIVDAALSVHRALGPGLLESVYEACLARELTLREMPFRAQVALPVRYKDVSIDAGFRIDLIVAESVVVELKAVEKMLPLFEAQILTYLKLTNLRLGLLINFNTALLKDGIRRIVL